MDNKWHGSLFILCTYILFIFYAQGTAHDESVQTPTEIFIENLIIMNNCLSDKNIILIYS